MRGRAAYCRANPELGPTQQKVIAVPQITRNIAGPGDLLLICCDGLVEQMTTAEAGKFFRENLSSRPLGESKQPDLAQSCYDLNFQSLAKNSRDNHSGLLHECSVVIGVCGCWGVCSIGDVVYCVCVCVVYVCVFAVYAFVCVCVCVCVCV